MALLGCGGDSPASTPGAVIDEPATNAPTGPAPQGDPGVTIEQAILACREKNAGKLRAFVAADLMDSEIEALFSRGRDVRLLLQAEPEIFESNATVDVRQRVERETGAEEVALLGSRTRR
jgi:hypothetical protein